MTQAFAAAVDEDAPGRHRQHRLDRGEQRRADAQPLRRGQGRRRDVHQGGRARVRPARHPRQRGVARPDLEGRPRRGVARRCRALSARRAARASRARRGRRRRVPLPRLGRGAMDHGRRTGRRWRRAHASHRVLEPGAEPRSADDLRRAKSIRRPRATSSRCRSRAAIYRETWRSDDVLPAGGARRALRPRQARRQRDLLPADRRVPTRSRRCIGCRPTRSSTSTSATPSSSGGCTRTVASSASCWATTSGGQHGAVGGAARRVAGLTAVPGRALSPCSGTTMAPGFDPRDYEHGDRERLLAAFPARARWSWR